MPRDGSNGGCISRMSIQQAWVHRDSREFSRPALRWLVTPRGTISKWTHTKILWWQVCSDGSPDPCLSRSKSTWRRSRNFPIRPRPTSRSSKAAADRQQVSAPNLRGQEKRTCGWTDRGELPGDNLSQRRLYDPNRQQTARAQFRKAADTPEKRPPSAAVAQSKIEPVRPATSAERRHSTVMIWSALPHFRAAWTRRIQVASIIPVPSQYKCIGCNPGRRSDIRKPVSAFYCDSPGIDHDTPSRIAVRLSERPRRCASLPADPTRP